MQSYVVCLCYNIIQSYAVCSCYNITQLYVVCWYYSSYHTIICVFSPISLPKAIHMYSFALHIHAFIIKMALCHAGAGAISVISHENKFYTQLCHFQNDALKPYRNSDFKLKLILSVFCISIWWFYSKYYQQFFF